MTLLARFAITLSEIRDGFNSEEGRRAVENLGFRNF